MLPSLEASSSTFSTALEALPPKARVRLELDELKEILSRAPDDIMQQTDTSFASCLGKTGLTVPAVSTDLSNSDLAIFCILFRNESTTRLKEEEEGFELGSSYHCE